MKKEEEDLYYVAEIVNAKLTRDVEFKIICLTRLSLADS